MSEKVKFEHDLGSVVEDKVTGFQGTVTGSFVFINGCKRYAVEGRVEEGKAHSKANDDVFDEDRLTPVKQPKTEIPQKRTGGPRANPSVASDPV